jgi:hypothetical protein
MAPLGDALKLLFSELLDGPSDQCYVLNTGDRGLLRSLDALAAGAASAVPSGGGASIAAHVHHVWYGLTLLNRWVEGDENPWRDADWTASWQRQTVSEDEWEALRERFQDDARRWLKALSRVRDLEGVELNGAIASVVHLAYHVGAIRQIDRSARGPSAAEAAS